MRTEVFAAQPIDQREFRSALGQFPTGVAVITAEAPDGVRVGMTVTSFNSVSLDPPLVLFSIGVNAYSLNALKAAGHYAVNVLAEGQQDVSAQFARAGADKWAGIATREHEGLPFTLDGCLATFQCEQFAQYDGGDHIIFVGRVLRVEQRGAGRPLVFFGGRYAALAAAPDA